MTRIPAAGERAALRGYRWQYDQIAALVYDALLDDDFHALRLTDPEAGRVDDLVLERRAGITGYQFKSVAFDSYVSFRQLENEQRTRSGDRGPSLLRALGDGWTRLCSRYNEPHVRLVMQHLASINDHLAGPDVLGRPSPDHLSAFLNRVLDPLQTGRIALGDVPPGWQPVLRRLHEASGVAADAFEEFLHSLHLDLGAGSALPPSPSTRRDDVITLSDALSRLVANSSDVVELNLDGVLELVGWTDRPRLRSRHEFPVDLDTYAPLGAAIKELDAQLTRHDRGYIAVVGPIGAGKSTLLSQALTGRTDRIIRYYAYVPGSAPARTRLSAHGFLHDLVVMLTDSGLTPTERELVSDDIHALRQQLADRLDAAGEEFARTGRCTILVVDGLDHVDREYPGNDGLLAELPKPDELPIGVFIVAGSRTLAPLRAHARQQVEEREAVVDLQHHRLTPSAVLEVCRRAPLTATLTDRVHRRIAELCDGYPLALSYLLNRLRDADDEDAEKVLANAPAYAGDIAAEYLAAWDALNDAVDVVAILAVISRLRVGFTTQWLETWASPSTVRTFRLRLLYLFRHHHDGWRFFHDSFRQFAADRTAQGDSGRPDVAVDMAEHARVAEICAASAEPRFAAEELYHRYCAGESDAVLHLGQQAAFREQYRQLRSPEAIRSDIELTLRTAADGGDVSAVLRMLLALVEVSERSSALENVDMPGLLFDAGLIDEAIGYCGGEARRVPLAQAYELATRLGRADDPAGRRIFDLVEHDGFDDPGRARVSGHEDDAARAWARAAGLFRPLPSVLTAARSLLALGTEDDGRNGYGHRRRRDRYTVVMRALIDTVAERNDDAALLAVDAALADDAAQVSPAPNDAESSDAKASDVATIVDLRVRVHRVLLLSAATADDAQLHLGRLLSFLRDVPLFATTILDAAEVAARYGGFEAADALIQDSHYAHALTVNELSYNGDPQAVERRFRYWRLRHLLARLTSGDDDIPTSVQPSDATPAGDDVVADAAVHADIQAIQLASRIDAAIRTLARIDAATRAGDAVWVSDVWAAIVPLLDVFRPSTHGRTSPTLSGIAQQRPELMRLLVRVVLTYGSGLPQRLSGMLSDRFREQPDEWPTNLWLQVAQQLRDAGVTAPWYAEALAEEEANAAGQDVYSRLEISAALVGRHTADGDIAEARRLALTLVPMAFGVGYRKDYQFDTWVGWLRRALAEHDAAGLVDEAVWLARVLVAAEPMTEGAPGSAAAELPATVVPVAPLAGVRIFEYLVRHGTVDHMDTLAALIGALVAHTRTADGAAVQLAADMTGELIAPTASLAYPQLAKSLVSAARRVVGAPAATALADSVASRTDVYALPTTRAAWKEGLGVGLGAGEPDNTGAKAAVRSDDYGALVLSDGRRIPRGDVPALVSGVENIVELRRQESADSSFSWARVVEGRRLSAEDVRALGELFDDGTRPGGDVLAFLAESAEGLGDTELASRLAEESLRQTALESWSDQWGGARRRAFAVAVRIGGRDSRIDACRDLATQATAKSWFARLVLSELADIVNALDSDTSAARTWPEVRGYLDGVAMTLTLPDADVLQDHGCRWWLSEPGDDLRAPTGEVSVPVALAELAVGHLSHPTWVVHDAAARVVVLALVRGDDSVAAALTRFAQRDAADDILEVAGRCLAAARSVAGYATPSCLQPLEHTLANHRSQVLRDLAPGASTTAYRPLSPLYHLSLPALANGLIGQEAAFLAPHESQYRMLANGLGLDIDTLLRVAERYAREARAVLPTEDAVRTALTAEHVQHVWPSQTISASRAAFGRVLADLTDAKLLIDLPAHVRRRLRTVDVALLTQAPQARPSAVPPPPPAGHDQTLDRWRAETDDRLHEYVGQFPGSDRVLIAATSRLTVLNWGHLEEEVVCGTVVGNAPFAEGDVLLHTSSMLLRDLSDTTTTSQPGNGEPLVLANLGWTFHQLAADWLSFRPDVAPALDWSPDTTCPGRWYTAAGELAVESVWWVDGWWGRAGPEFDDTEAEGHVVLLTGAGLADILGVFGPITRHFTLTRRGREDGKEGDPVVAKRSSPALMPTAPQDS
jgi:hypothetical protein